MMITQKQISEIVKRVVENYHPDKIILFGSYAYGKPNKDSDLDLLIVKDDPASKIERHRKVRSYFKGLMIPVDVIVKTNEEFNRYKNIIGTIVYPAAKYGKVMYDAAA